jgi:hypothetical protein
MAALSVVGVLVAAGAVAVACTGDGDVDIDPGLLGVLADAPSDGSLTTDAATGVVIAEDGTAFIGTFFSIDTVTPDGDVEQLVSNTDNFEPAGDAGPEEAAREDVELDRSRGIALDADGSLLVGTRGALGRVTEDGERIIVLGGTGAVRPLDAAVPDAVPAADLELTEWVAPVGVLPDGTLALVDGPVLWSYNQTGGALRPLYRRSAPSTTTPFALSGGAAIDAAGSVYVMDATLEPVTLDAIVTVAADGTTGTAPAVVDGLDDERPSLRVLDLSSDDGDVVALVGDDSSRAIAVLRLAGDRWEVIVRGEPANACADLDRAVPVLEVPQTLGQAVGIRGGRVVLPDVDCDRVMQATLEQ